MLEKRNRFTVEDFTGKQVFVFGKLYVEIGEIEDLRVWTDDADYLADHANDDMHYIFWGKNYDEELDSVTEHQDTFIGTQQECLEALNVNKFAVVTVILKNGLYDCLSADEPFYCKTLEEAIDIIMDLNGPAEIIEFDEDGEETIVKKNYNNFAVDFGNGIAEDDLSSVDKAKQYADSEASYNQQNIKIINTLTDQVVAIRYWVGVKADEEALEEDIIDFGDFGYYGVWQ